MTDLSGNRSWTTEARALIAKIQFIWLVDLREVAVALFKIS
jgi:hypothetical protein